MDQHCYHGPFPSLLVSTSHAACRCCMTARVLALGIKSDAKIGGAAEVAGISAVVSLSDAHSAVSKQLPAG
jgi:hypothetical protein